MDDYERKKAADTDPIMLTVPKSALCFHITQAKPEYTRPGKLSHKTALLWISKSNLINSPAGARHNTELDLNYHIRDLW